MTKRVGLGYHSRSFCIIGIVHLAGANTCTRGKNPGKIGSGFSTSKQPAPAQRPEFSVEPGQKSGSVLLRRQAVKGAKAYIWQFSINVVPQGEEGWTITGQRQGISRIIRSDTCYQILVSRGCSYGKRNVCLQYTGYACGSLINFG